MSSALSSSPPDADQQRKIEAILAHMVSMKDVIAAGIRSPALLAATLDKAPKEPRLAILAADQKIKTMFAECDAVAAESSLTAAAATTSEITSPGRFAGLSPFSSKNNNNNNSTTTPKRPSAILPQSSPAAADFGSPQAHSPLVKCIDEWRSAVLGATEKPQPIGLERFPQSGCSGLIHGNDKPLRSLLARHRLLLGGLYVLLTDGETHDHLSFLNMMWVQHHPADFEAAALEATRVQSMKKPQQQQQQQSSSSRGSQQPSTSGGGITAVVSSSMLTSATSRTSQLENSMRYLLFLNLKLKFPVVESWAPLLSLRDELLCALRSLRIEFEQSMSSAEASSSSSSSIGNECASVVRTLSTWDAVISSLSLMNIFSTPDDIQSLLFEKSSNALMEMQIILHEHDDVMRMMNKRVNECFEQTCHGAVDALKKTLQELQAIWKEESGTDE